MNRHLLSMNDLDRQDILAILGTAESMHDVQRREVKKLPTLRGRTVVNMFFEDSTRTRSSFELAGKWLSADVINISGKGSSTSKGESLRDTVRTVAAMGVDGFVIRHSASGAAQQVSGWVDAVVINAGDGTHEHPTQALLDALTIRRRGRKFEGLVVAICGDVLHSRVARSNINLLLKMGARVRLIAPRTLLPGDAERFGVEIFHDMRKGLEGVDVVMMLRLQLERMSGAFVPSTREYFRFYGLDAEKLKLAKPGALVMHPGPMNRGVEIDSAVADDIEVSVIQEQVEMGVAIRMAVLDALSRGLAVEGRNAP